jgi:hypothetical protein
MLDGWKQIAVIGKPEVYLHRITEIAIALNTAKERLEI